MTTHSPLEARPMMSPSGDKANIFRGDVLIGRFFDYQEGDEIVKACNGYPELERQRDEYKREYFASDKHNDELEERLTPESEAYKDRVDELEQHLKQKEGVALLEKGNADQLEARNAELVEALGKPNWELLEKVMKHWHPSIKGLQRLKDDLIRLKVLAQEQDKG